MLDPVFALLLRCSLALLFGAAAFHKLRAPRAFAETLGDYALLPIALVPWVAAALGAGELLLVIGLLVPVAVAAAALGGAGLLGVYSGAIAINLARGRRDIDCGCLGPAGRQPLSARLLVRNVLLIAACLALLAPVGARALFWVDALSVAGGSAAFALLWSAVQRIQLSAPGLADPGRSS